MTTTGGTRIVFYGFGAFVGAIRGPTQCDWWPDDPARLNFAPSALVPTDLAKNPMAARSGAISVADIQCDDHRTDGGLTAVGPRFPQGSTVGAIWLSESYWSSLGAKQPPRAVTKDAHDYELTSILYLDGPMKGRRFYGVHAKVVGTQGPLTRVELWHAGRAKVPGERPAGAFWMDLAQVAHPIEPGATQIGAGQVEGALFLEDTTSRQVTLMSPKLPPGSGSELFP